LRENYTEMELQLKSAMEMSEDAQKRAKRSEVELKEERERALQNAARLEAQLRDTLANDSTKHSELELQLKSARAMGKDAQQRAERLEVELKEERERAEVQLRDALAKLDALTEKHSKTESHLDTTMTIYKDAQKRAERLEAELKDERERMPHDATGLATQLRDSLATHDALTEKHSEMESHLKSAREMSEDAQKRAARLEVELKEERGRIPSKSALTSQHAADLEAQLRDALAAHGALREERSEMELQLKSSRAMAEDAKKRADRFEAALKIELDRTPQDGESLLGQLRDAEAYQRALAEKLADSELRLDSARARGEDAQKRAERLEEVLAEKLAESEAEKRSEMDLQLSYAQAMGEDAQKRNECLEKELHEERERIERLEKELQEERERMQLALRQHEEASQMVVNTQEQLEKLEKRLHTAEEEHLNAKANLEMANERADAAELAARSAATAGDEPMSPRFEAKFQLHTFVMKGLYGAALQKKWRDFGTEEDLIIRRAYLVGQPIARFTIGGQQHEYNFTTMSQKNLVNMKERDIRPPPGVRPPRKPLLPNGPIVVLKVGPGQGGQTIVINDPNNPGKQVEVNVPRGIRPGQKMAVPVPEKGENVEDVQQRQKLLSPMGTAGVAAVSGLAVGGAILGAHLDRGEDADEDLLGDSVVDAGDFIMTIDTLCDTAEAQDKS